MKKVNKKQRLRDFIESHPRGAITRLAEYVGVSPVSVHSWLDEEKGWMTRNNEKKVEEFIAQEQEAAQSILPESEVRKETLPTLDVEDFAREMWILVTKYIPKENLAGVVKEMMESYEQSRQPKRRRSDHDPHAN